MQLQADMAVLFHKKEKPGTNMEIVFIIITEERLLY